MKIYAKNVVHTMDDTVSVSRMNIKMKSAIKKAYEDRYDLEIFYKNGQIEIGSDIASSYTDGEIESPHMTLRLSAISYNEISEDYTISNRIIFSCKIVIVLPYSIMV